MPKEFNSGSTLYIGEDMSECEYRQLSFLKFIPQNEDLNQLNQQVK